MSFEPPASTLLTGTVHGKHLDLDQEIGFPDGRVVSVVICPVREKLPPGEGLRRAIGGWGEDPAGVDEFLIETRKWRDLETERVTT